MKLRRPTPGEAELMAEVFGPGIDSARVRLLTGAPTGGLAFVMFSLMVFPTPTPDFSAENALTRSWFVHEAAHVWQFRHRPLWTLLSWLKVALGGGYSRSQTAYRYTLPLDWTMLNLEQQARAIEHAWLLKGGIRTMTMPQDARPEDYSEACSRAFENVAAHHRDGRGSN